MKASLIFGLVALVAASLAAVRPAGAADLLYRGPIGPSWNTIYYDPAWGMPEAVVVPPTARKQWNYSWGVGGSRLSLVGPRYQVEFPGPPSAYNQRDYLPTPPQPSNTRQFGVNYVRGPWR